MKRFTALAVAILLISAIFCGCSSGEEETTQATTQEETTAEQEASAYARDVNLLTGINDLTDGAIGKRPVAVMINNIKAALPQYGVSDADIMFEVLVEGGITRMMAIYGDYTQIPNVCSVRSCRYYFPIFAYGFDAVYCCYGSNKSLGTATLKRLDMDYFDGQFYGSLYGRDSERLKTYSREHTAYLKGKSVPSAIESEGMRSDILKDKSKPFFNFNSPDSPQTLSDTACTKAVLQFSDYYWSTFNYDTESKTYLKQHETKNQMDSATGKQLAFTNVFVLVTSVNQFNDGTGLMEVNWKGGTGYYISMGTVIPIKWSKPTEQSSIKITDTDGEEISVNAGKSYFGVIAKGCTKLEPSETATTAS